MAWWQVGPLPLVERTPLVCGNLRYQLRCITTFAGDGKQKKRVGEPATNGSTCRNVRQPDLHDDCAHLYGGSAHSEKTGAKSFGAHLAKTVDLGWRHPGKKSPLNGAGVWSCNVFAGSGCRR